MLEWLANIAPHTINIEKKFSKITEYGKSNPYIVDISTTSTYTNVAPINLFGANVNRFLPNQGNTQKDISDNYTVLTRYGYSDYTENSFLANTMQAPFEIGILRIETINPSLFVAQNTTINCTENDPTGKQKTTAISLFRRLNQYIDNAVEFNFSDLHLIINGDMQLQFNIANPNSYFIFYFYPSARASFKILREEGYFGNKFSLPSLPMSADADILTTPIPISLRDNGVAVSMV